MHSVIRMHIILQSDSCYRLNVQRACQFSNTVILIVYTYNNYHISTVGLLDLRWPEHARGDPLLPAPPPPRPQVNCQISLRGKSTNIALVKLMVDTSLYLSKVCTVASTLYVLTCGRTKQSSEVASRLIIDVATPSKAMPLICFCWDFNPIKSKIIIHVSSLHK